MVNYEELFASPGAALVGVTAVAGALFCFVITVIGRMRNKKPTPFLTKANRGERLSVTLVEKESLSHDVVRFRFKLPSPEMPFGLPCGRHIKVYLPNVRDQAKVSGEWNGRPDKEEGAEIERKYSPVTDSLGYFDLMLKVYARGEKERFPDGGKASQQLNEMAVGTRLQISGPAGHVTYLGTSPSGGSLIKVGARTTETSNLGFIAGGTGLTPILRVINAILRDPKNNTKLSLLFANQTEEDIFLRSSLDSLADEFPVQFHRWYTVDRPPTEWAFSSGFINEAMIAEHLPAQDAEGNPMVMMCGPPPMINYACVPNLEKLGYDKRRYVSF